MRRLGTQPKKNRANNERRMASKDIKHTKGKLMSSVSIRHMIDDDSAAVQFYMTHLGFTLDLDASPAFASVTRDGVRLLLSGKTSSGRRAMPDGWNRIHIQVEDLEPQMLGSRILGSCRRGTLWNGTDGGWRC